MDPKRVIFMLAIFAMFVTHTQADNETKPVYFSLIVFRGENPYHSSGVIPAIDIALEKIERHQLLRNYSLIYSIAQISKVGLQK